MKQRDVDEVRMALDSFLALKPVWRNLILGEIHDAFERRLFRARLEYAALVQIEGPEIAKLRAEFRNLQIWQSADSIWAPIYLWLAEQLPSIRDSEGPAS